MSFEVGRGPTFWIGVAEVVQAAEAFCSQLPILCGETGLKDKRPRTFDNGSVGTLNDAIRLRTMGI